MPKAHRWLTPALDAGRVVCSRTRVLGLGASTRALAEGFDVRAPPHRPVLDALKRRLAQHRVLLVLDNFEQLLPATPLLTDLLQASAGLTLLVTSRSPLDLRMKQSRG